LSERMTMKLAINRQAFSTALGEAATVAASRTPKPILQCVLLRTVDRALVVMATDLETSLRVGVPQVEVSDPGAAVVSAEKLTAIVRESSDEVLHVETDAQFCHIRGEDSHFQIFMLDPAEYPPIPDLEGEPHLRVPAEELARMIAYTCYAAAKENTRFAINGLLWEKRGRRLRLVATDGRRLALAMGAAADGGGENVEAIVPLKAVSTLQRVLADVEGDVRVRMTPNQIVAQAGLATVSSVLVEGHFPKYEDVIPQDNDKKVEMNAGEFLRALKRAALLTTQESRGVRLSFKKGVLELTSRAPEQGEAHITLPIEYEYEPLAIGFNPGLLIDALKALEPETVEFSMKEANRPGLLRAGTDFTYVVMPVNLS